MTTPLLHSAVSVRELRGGWQLWEYDEVTSTNLVAAKLEVWNAVRADTQTAGRGRFQRAWVSDAGGLWLSAVVPVETNSSAWRLLPLATGVAVCEVLRGLNVRGLRLRWPNDVLVGERKLAGLLIDQFQPGRAVVGIGLNVANQPEARDGQLTGHVMRLADLLDNPPGIPELAEKVLVALKSVHEELGRDIRRSASLLARINALWALPRRVEADLDGPRVRGEFFGVDATGRLLLGDDHGHRHSLEPQDVRLLRDCH